MVPEGWNICRIGDLVTEFRQKTKTQDEHPILTSSRSGLIPQAEYYSGSRITSRDNIGFHVVPPEHITYRSRSDDGQFFFNRNDTGSTGIVSHFYPVFHFSKGDPRFLLEFINLNRQEFSKVAVGTSQQVLSFNALKSVSFPLPPLPEQRKIAEILSTWDRAIETTEALLAAAKAQKRALMQTLLTGKRRFPEFEGQPWREVRLGEIASVIVSNVDKKTDPSERPVRLCNYTDVYKRETIDPSQIFMAATATPAQIKRFGLRRGDVIITKDSETADDIAMPTYVAETADDLVCGYHLAIIRPKRGTDGRFLKFYFELPRVRHYFGTRANGAIRFGLTLDGIEGAAFKLPSPDEQRRVAEVLADAEADIARLAADIEKLRTEKSALMQQLLTGKRRVRV